LTLLVLRLWQRLRKPSSLNSDTGCKIRQTFRTLTLLSCLMRFCGSPMLSPLLLSVAVLHVTRPGLQSRRAYGQSTGCCVRSGRMQVGCARATLFTGVRNSTFNGAVEDHRGTNGLEWRLHDRPALSMPSGPQTCDKIVEDYELAYFLCRLLTDAIHPCPIVPQTKPCWPSSTPCGLPLPFGGSLGCASVLKGLQAPPARQEHDRGRGSCREGGVVLVSLLWFVAVTDLRAPFAVDASPWKGAAVEASVSPAFARALWRHGERKAHHSRLDRAPRAAPPSWGGLTHAGYGPPCGGRHAPPCAVQFAQGTCLCLRCGFRVQQLLFSSHCLRAEA